MTQIVLCISGKWLLWEIIVIVSYICNPCRFMKEWLCNGYSDQHKIFEDYESGELTKEEKNVLMGVHIRSCSLVTSPSLLDIQRAEHIFSK